MPDVWFLSFRFWAAFSLLVAVIAWRVRDRAQVRRQVELRLAVQQRTEQLESGRAVEASRNRILEMLVSNASLNAVLDAIAKSVCDQLPQASCVVLVKQVHGLKQNGLKQSNGFFVGAAPAVPAAWLSAISHQQAVPFEVWRQMTEYHDLRNEPALRLFVSEIDVARLPETIHSVPIGENETSRGAILLFYPEQAGNEPWERILRVSARLAHIAIEHRRFCDELDYRAHHDNLTGLPNRSLLNARLDDAIMQARSRGRRLAFLYIDVDEFKQINDRFSHRAGDEFLVELGNRIKTALGEGDTLARIGGDEFNVLLPDIGDAAAAMEVASKILETVRKPVSIDASELTVTLSIGVAMFPDDGEHEGDAAADLRRQADAAMYYAKSLGKNRAQAFAENTRTLDSVRLEQDLRHALREGWFEMYYQPKFAASGQLAGMEALIRLNHPRHGQILPGRFIGIAESTGLIVPIGAWVLNEVCRQIADWRRRNLDPVVVAVNVSALQVACSDFARSVEACLTTHSIPANSLEIEVTESIVVNPDSKEHCQLQLLRNLGIYISVDDFGTGFSSLSYLHRLPIDAVKLDRSFVQTIDTDRGARHLVRAVIGVAQGLGFGVVAEGVETEAQRLELVAAGCPVMQGYLFAYPGPPETVEPLLYPHMSRADSASADLNRLYEAIEAASRPTVVPTGFPSVAPVSVPVSA
jgi:diguanylate cyclase (GGDEF)-like protein